MVDELENADCRADWQTGRPDLRKRTCRTQKEPRWVELGAQWPGRAGGMACKLQDAKDVNVKVGAGGEVGRRKVKARSTRGQGVGKAGTST